MLRTKGTWLSAWSLVLLTGCQSGLLPMASTDVSIGDGQGSFSIAANQEACLITESLRAGQTIPIGNVIITSTETNILVTYQTTDGWLLKHTHVNLSADLESVPQSGGNAPINGQFTSQTAHEPAATTYTYTFSRADYADFDTLYILTHAEAVSPEGTSETAYGGNQDWPLGSRWAYYSKFNPCAISDIPTEESPEPEPTAEPTEAPQPEPTVSTTPTPEPSPEPDPEPTVSSEPVEENSDEPESPEESIDETEEVIVEEPVALEEEVDEAHCPTPVHMRRSHQHPHHIKRVKWVKRVVKVRVKSQKLRPRPRPRYVPHRMQNSRTHFRDVNSSSYQEQLMTHSRSNRSSSRMQKMSRSQRHMPEKHLHMNTGYEGPQYGDKDHDCRC